MSIKYDTVQKVFEEYPKLKELTKRKTLRKYEIQDALLVTRAEADMIIQKLTASEAMENTSIGWKFTEDALIEMHTRGVI